MKCPETYELVERLSCVRVADFRGATGSRWVVEVVNPYNVYSSMGFPCQKQTVQSECLQRAAYASPLGIHCFVLSPNMCCQERSFEIFDFPLFRNVVSLD